MTSIAQLMQRSRELETVSDTPQLDIELLLCHLLSVKRVWLKTWPEKQLSAGELAAFNALLHRRRTGEPIAYITGRKAFWNSELLLQPGVLIPRPETELLVESALQMPMPVAARVLDLGTGSGNIALALAEERPDWELTAIDRDAGALALAEQNCQHLKISNLRFMQSNWFSALGGQRFHMLVSNPPYVARGDLHLEQNGLPFEPRMALVSGADGLDALRVIVASSPAYLTAPGWLLVEHGYQQGSAVRALFEKAGFTDIATRQDSGGRERITLGRYPAPD